MLLDHEKAAEVLLKHKANPRVKNNGGVSPMDIAIALG